MKFADMLQLEPHGPDTYVATGPRYPWGSLYGGQIVMQGLKAAAQSVREGQCIHSLHAYFIRRGQHETPVRFEVDRIRDGRTFTTRRVVARQSEGAILNMSCSFQEPEGELGIQTRPMPDVLGPDDVQDRCSWLELFDRRTVESSAEGRCVGWFKTATPIGDDPLDHACALAYLSDDFPCDVVRMRHPDSAQDPSSFWMASLDHAIWFHHPVRADQWLLQDFRCQTLIGTRGLAVGYLFAPDGTHVATVNQEALLRRKR